jgi:hypothetical protein
VSEVVKQLISTAFNTAKAWVRDKLIELAVFAIANMKTFSMLSIFALA